MRQTFKLTYLTLASLTICRSAIGFNINTDTIFRQYSGNDDSFFGYALEFMDKDWLLVGAPKDNDTLLPATFEPGRLLRCRISGNGPCEPITVDNKTNYDNEWNIYFRHGRDRSWLGASIDIPLVDLNKGIVVCAPRWYNRQDSGKYFMNGLCYTIPVDLNVNNIEKFPILVPLKYQVYNLDSDTTIIIHGMASMGWSAHYTASNMDILFGAPGLVQWTGGFVRKMTGQQFTVMISSYEDVYKTHNQYIGYSITSGKYFSDNLEYYVVGAPRAELIGKIYFFLGGMDKYHLDDNSLELAFLDADNKELPLNSYFGASLCTVDVNSDGFDDLLVGAPLYGNVSSSNEDHKQDLIDVGRAYLYLGNKEKTEFGMNVQTFYGDMKTGARFGSAITSLGDINKDGFNDVAIGAPYEDDMMGAVYVYNGYKDGLWAMYSQKITARNLDSQLRAFGHAISKPMDINSDDINDVAIGSYLSGHVTVLLGQPVINMKATMVVRESGSGDDLIVIDKNSNKTYVKACFEYQYRQCTRVMLNVTITLDTEKGELSRVYFSKIQRPLLNLEIASFSGDRSCSNSEDGQIFFKPTFDLVSPVVVSVKYEMVDSTCPPGSNPTISKFNGQNPSDPLLQLSKKLQIKNECLNNTCTTDLHLDAVAIYNNVNGFFVVGTPSLTLNISITKSGDPSYGSLFRVTIPNSLKYRKMEQVSGNEVVTCSLENVIDDKKSELEKYKNESLLECSFGNPLKQNSGVVYLLHFQVPDSISDDFLQFRMEASTLSRESDQKDNYRNLEIKLKNHVGASLSGVTNPDTLLIQEQTDNYDLIHVYELENQGPSLLPAANIKIHYPQIQSGQTASLYLNRTKVQCPRPCEMECTVSDDMKLLPVWTEINGRSYYVNTPSEEAGLTALSYLNCETGICLIYNCTLMNLAPQQSVSVTLDFVVSKEVGGILKSQKSLELISVAKAHLNAPNLISDKIHLQYKLKTVLLPRVPPKTGVNWWIILVSVLCGLLLIAILILILYKVGFFKRKRFPQPPPKADIEKEKLSDEKASVSLTDSEHDVIDKDEKQDIK